MSNPIFGRLSRCKECHGSYRQSSLNHRGLCEDCEESRLAYSRILHDERQAKRELEINEILAEYREAKQR